MVHELKRDSILIVEIDNKKKAPACLLIYLPAGHHLIKLILPFDGCPSYPIPLQPKLRDRMGFHPVEKVGSFHS
jgi:hypothetical protein